MKQAIMTSPGKIQTPKHRGPDAGTGRSAAAHPAASALRLGCARPTTASIRTPSIPSCRATNTRPLVEAVAIRGDRSGKEGMKVTSMPQIVCGESAPCQHGDYHICDKLKVEGFQAQGSAQEVVGHEHGQDHPAARPLQLRAGRAGGSRSRSPCTRLSRAPGVAPLAGRRVAVLGCGADRQPCGAGGAQRGREGPDHRPECLSPGSRAEVRADRDFER